MACNCSEIKLENIVLTKGESSDLYEIYSKESLNDFKASYRITTGDGVEVHSEDLNKTREIKNDDSIFNDHITYKLEGKEYENVNGVQEFSESIPLFNHKIKITSLTKQELSETMDFEGKVFDVKTIDTIKKKSELTPDEEKYVVEEYTEGSEIMVILRKNEEVGVLNCEVTLTFTSIEKETSRVVKAFTNESGVFSGSVFLGNTIKQESGKGFCFIIGNEVTELLDKGRYVVTVTVQKVNSMDEVVYSKEIIQTKLDINDKI